MIAASTSAVSIHAPDSLAWTSVDGDQFRQAMRRLAGGVCIVTTVDRSGRNLGLTATAVASVSLDPPLVLVCIDRRSRTIPPLAAGTPFVVHFLAAGQEALARRFASFAVDKFEGIGHFPTPRGCPRLEGVPTSVECAVHRLVPAGDHVIVLGRAIDVYLGNGEGDPLLYFDGRYV